MAWSVITPNHHMAVLTVKGLNLADRQKIVKPPNYFIAYCISMLVVALIIKSLSWLFSPQSFCEVIEQVRSVNSSRPSFTQWALILKVITPCAKKEVWQRKTSSKLADLAACKRALINKSVLYICASLLCFVKKRKNNLHALPMYQAYKPNID